MVILGSFSKIFTIFLACPQNVYYLYINKHKLNPKVMKTKQEMNISVGSSQQDEPKLSSAQLKQVLEMLKNKLDVNVKSRMEDGGLIQIRVELCIDGEMIGHDEDSFYIK